MNAFVILSEAKDLTTGVANTNVYRGINSLWGRSSTAFAVRDDSALDTRAT
jgi:hypothetical protein